MEAPTKTRAPPPLWIDEEFIETALKNKEKKKFSLDSMDVKYASVEGTGYASLIFRVAAFLKDEGSEETRKERIIVKVALESGAMKEFLECRESFNTESLMLHEVIPQLHEALTSVEGDTFEPLAAQCYHWGKQPAEFLVLEDLVAAGFQLAEPGHPLDYKHCAVVLRAYARLHAASALLISKQPHYKDTFASHMFSNEGSLAYCKALGSKVFCSVANELDKCPGYEQYSDKYRRLNDRYSDIAYEFIGRSKSETKLLVLLHGDCWKNNMMFKYVDGEVSDVRLVDFQESTVASPASDLQCFLYANASEEVHRHHMDSLLAEYHRTLVDTLRRLGMQAEAEAFTIEELQRDMDRCLLVAVFYSAMSGFVLTSEKYGSEFGQFFNDPEQQGDEALAKAFRNPYSLSYVKYLTPIFDSKGIL